MIGKQFIDLFFRVETKKAKKDIDDVGDGLKNVGISGKIAQGGLNLMSKGFKAVGMAMKAAGIGLVIGLLSQLTGVFQSNQKVADTFGRIMLKLKPVFDAVGDVIAFVAGVLEDLIDLFSGAIGFIGKLIGVTDGASSSTAALADEIVHLRNEQKLMNAELALTQLQYQREAELQRQIRDDTSKTMEERIAANEELGKILEEQGQVEREMALVGLDLARKELSLDRDNIDLQVALTEAKTKLAEIDERITGQRSEQIVNLTSLEKERADKQKEYSERIQKELEEEQEAYDDILKKMKQHIEVAKEELTLTEKLEAAEEAFTEAKKHLATLKETDTTANKQAIKDSEDLIKQKKLESQAIQDEINDMAAQDAALEEFEDAHANQKEDVLAIYDEMYSGLTGKSKEYFEKQKLMQKIQDAEDLDELKIITRDLEELRREYNETLRNIKGGKDEGSFFTQEELKADKSIMQGYVGEFDSYFDSLEEQTKHKFDNQIKQNQKELEEKKRVIDDEIKQIEEQNGIIVTKDEELKKKIEEAERVFNETQITLKAQNLAAVLEFMKTEQEKEVDAVAKKYDDIIAKTIEGSDHEEDLIEQKRQAIQDINDRYDEEDREKTRSFLQNHLNMVKEFNEKQEEEEKARKELALDSALSMMNSLLSISKTQADKETKQLDLKLKKGKITEQKYNQELLKIEQEQLRKEKKAALLQIGVDTASGISSAVKAGAGIPFPANLAAIGAGVAAVLGGVAQAASVLGQSVDVGVETSSNFEDNNLSGDVPALPTFGAAGSDVPPVQAFVVETNISNAQALQSELDLQSTL